MNIRCNVKLIVNAKYEQSSFLHKILNYLRKEIPSDNAKTVLKNLNLK